MKAVDCKYKEYDRRLRKQFKNSLDDEVIIIRELTALKDTSWFSSNQVLLWARGLEAPRVQKEVLGNIRDAKEFASVSKDKQKHDNIRQSKKKMKENCKYCSEGHLQRLCSACGQTCDGCCKMNHFKAVCKTTQRQQQDQRLSR